MDMSTTEARISLLRIDSRPPEVQKMGPGSARSVLLKRYFAPIFELLIGRLGEERVQIPSPYSGIVRLTCPLEAVTAPQEELAKMGYRTTLIELPASEGDDHDRFASADG